MNAIQLVITFLFFYLSPTLAPAQELTLKYSADAVFNGGVFEARVRSVERGGPAERAGLLPGDFIIRINGVRPTSQKAMNDAYRARGRQVQLEIRRGTQTGTLNATAVPVTPIDPPIPQADFGLVLENAFTGEPGIGKNGRVARIKSVNKGTRAEGYGFQPGDYVLQIHNFTVSSKEEAERAWGQMSDGARAQILIRRNGRTDAIYITR